MIDLLAYDPSVLTKDGEKSLLRMHRGGQGTQTSDGSNDGVSSVSSIEFSAATSTVDHLCLRVDPFDEGKLREFLDSKGVPICAYGEQRKGAEGVGPALYIEDPEGNVIELKGPSV